MNEIEELLFEAYKCGCISKDEYGEDLAGYAEFKHDRGIEDAYERHLETNDQYRYEAIGA